MLNECRLCQKCGHVHLTLDAEDSGCLDRGGGLWGESCLEQTSSLPLPHPHRTNHAMGLVLFLALSGLSASSLRAGSRGRHRAHLSLLSLLWSSGDVGLWVTSDLWIPEERGSPEPGAWAPPATRDHWARVSVHYSMYYSFTILLTIHDAVSFPKQGPHRIGVGGSDV